MGNADLMTQERQERIVILVNETGRLTVAELSDRFNVSEATIRRDLATLTAQNLVRRTHGGAMRLRPIMTTETPVMQRQSKFAKEKELIGTAAADLIKDNETLLIAGGSTGLAVARHLKNHNNLTIITDSLMVAEELLRQDQHRVMLLGGTIDPDERACRGSLAKLILKQLKVDKVVLGARAVSVDRGLSAETPEEADFFRTYIECGDNIILVTDSSKFHLSALAFLAPLDAFNTLVTDTNLDQEIAEQIQELGIYLLMV
jgi:DeoR/GlpR family transcriptional regulator of sugar metabolism